MGAFGDRLRREREMRGITLNEIAESTKIARRHLESLEKEDFDSLPGGIFNKGFVRAYARFLGIDEEQAVADYVANAPEAPPPEDKFPLEIHEQPKRKVNSPGSRMGWIGAAVAVAVLAIGYVVWARRGNQLGATSSVSAAGKAAANPAPAAKSAPAGKSETAKPEAAAKTNAPPASQAAPKQVAALVPSAPETPAPSAPAARPKPQPQEKTFFIIIKAKEDSWISVVADGRRVAHGTLRADKQRFIRAGKQIIVTTGNAGGLEVSYNGKPLGVIGNEAEARTLTFTPTGLAN